MRWPSLCLQAVLTNTEAPCSLRGPPFDRSEFTRESRPMGKFEKRYAQLKRILDGAEEDLMKFYENGNKAAGTRARKSLMELKKLAHEMRQKSSRSEKRSCRPPPERHKWRFLAAENTPLCL